MVKKILKMLFEKKRITYYWIGYGDNPLRKYGVKDLRK